MKDSQQAEDEKKRRNLDSLFCTGLLDSRKSAAKTVILMTVILLDKQLSVEVLDIAVAEQQAS